MDEIILEELERFKTMIQEQSYLKENCIFLNEDELEDEFSHNEIQELWNLFSKEAKKWLRENYPGQFVLYSDWCIHLLTIEYVQEKCPNLKRYLIQ